MKRQRRDEPYAKKLKITNKKVKSSLTFSDRRQRFSIQMRQDCSLLDVESQGLQYATRVASPNTSTTRVATSGS